MTARVDPLELGISPISPDKPPFRLSKYLAAASLFWLSSTASHFTGLSLGLPSIPIASDALTSLCFMYIPLFLLATPLLLFLTRNRSPVSWIDAYGIDPIHAKKEAGNITAYLIVTQLVLGLACKRGLHFPGPDVYEEGKHDQGDVLIWAGLYTVFYALLPAVWLHRSSAFSWSKLLSSLKWRENLPIIFVYWAIDFFGVLSDSDFLGLSPSQYALAIPAGIFANTLGAGIPVILIMHVLLIPRLAVLCPKKEYKDKLMVQANRLTTIALGGVSYAIFSLFDPGTDYNSASGASMSVSYIFMTQILIGMCKASFTVTTGNPIIHFICLHVISARVPLDTKMYGEIFGIVQ